jgi:hypothetical protein
VHLKIIFVSIQKYAVFNLRNQATWLFEKAKKKVVADISVL